MRSARRNEHRRAFLIKLVTDADDCRDCEKLQMQIWGFRHTGVVPGHTLRALSKEGGLVMNAYDRSGKAIGTSIAFLAKHERKLILYSDITGVIPESQSKEVGMALKLMQRNYAIRQGLDMICWTYDPMQSINNWFNLNKLGAVARNYYVNYYGDMQDSLNRGIDSDRFLAEWWVKSRRVREITRNGLPITSEGIHQYSIVNPTIAKDDVPRPTGQLDLKSREETILVEIPHNYEGLRKLGSAILREWRAETRRLYSHYFRRGYIATGAHVDESEGKRSFVRLERGPLRRILQS